MDLAICRTYWYITILTDYIIGRHEDIHWMALLIKLDHMSVYTFSVTWRHQYKYNVLPSTKNLKLAKCFYLKKKLFYEKCHCFCERAIFQMKQSFLLWRNKTEFEQITRLAAVASELFIIHVSNNSTGEFIFFFSVMCWFEWSELLQESDNISSIV